MIGKSTASTRLCPNCANTVAEDAMDCPYCKTDFSSQFTPSWLNRDDPSPEPRTGSDNQRRSSIPAKFIWMGAMFVAALIAFFAGSYFQRSESSLSSQAHLKQLQAKDQMIQNQEAQLAQTRRQLNESSHQLDEMKAKLDESRKELSLAQQRASAAARQADRQNTNRAVARTTASRAPEATASRPQPAAASGTAGVYETTRATSLHENPSSASRVVAQISGGTRINVVSSAGGWLEVHSKRGNPPGYVRSDDARPVGRAN